MAIYNRPRDPLVDPMNPRAADERVMTTVDRRSGFSPVLVLLLAIAALALAYLYLWPGVRDAAYVNGGPTTATSVPNDVPTRTQTH
jgi:hypothetical protein